VGVMLPFMLKNPRLYLFFRITIIYIYIGGISNEKGVSYARLRGLIVSP
jgi:hypothetical protein